MSKPQFFQFLWNFTNTYNTFRHLQIERAYVEKSRFEIMQKNLFMEINFRIGIWIWFLFILNLKNYWPTLWKYFWSFSIN